MQDQMQYVMDTSVQRVDELMAVRDVQFPEYDKKITAVHRRLKVTNTLLIEKAMNDRHLITKQICFKTLLDEVKNKKSQNGLVTKLVKNLNKLHLYHAFRRYHKRASWEVALKDKSKIDGAYLLLKRYKNRLKNYDIALERIDQKKCDKSDFEAFS